MTRLDCWRRLREMMTDLVNRLLTKASTRRSGRSRPVQGEEHGPRPSVPRVTQTVGQPDVG